MNDQSNTPAQRIFAIGRGANPVMIRKFRDLTNKEFPKICYLPTASGDNPQMIEWWHTMGSEYNFEPVVQKLFISSFDQKERFEDVLLNMDAIYVGGGNTVNMLAIWRVQGIDTILKEALQRGIVLGGGSAGGICWFENGLTDSRPQILTAMAALGWLKGSFAPHYLSEPGRRQYYHKYILDGSLSDGFGCDDSVGLLFENGEFVKAYGSVEKAGAFHVWKENGEILEREIEVEFVEHS